MSEAKDKNGILAWWFEPANGKLGYGDNRIPLVGLTHRVEGTPKLCNNGLHASIKPLDALQYAQSNIIWRVSISDDVQVGTDKIAGKSRTYLERIDISELLFDCSCDWALSVAHLWEMPQVVRTFLETRDKSLAKEARAAAGAAAWAAARDAAWNAAGAAARAAARAAAWNAAWAAAGAAARAAAWDAAGAAARPAAWNAARAAAWAAAWNAARAAAGDAAWDAARDAAWNAAWNAAWAAQNELLEKKLLILLCGDY